MTDPFLPPVPRSLRADPEVSSYLDQLNFVIETLVADVTTLQAAPEATWSYAIKTADETRTSDTTLTDDDTIKFSMLASTAYMFHGVIHWFSFATPDFQYSWNGPASPTRVRVVGWDVPQGGVGDNHFNHTAYGSAESVTGGANNSAVVRFMGLVTNGTTAGDFVFQWAQNTSDANTTRVEAGSWIAYRAIA